MPRPACALDLTAGCGRDTAFLARLAGPTGRVFALDLQPQALAETRAHLQPLGLLPRVTLLLGDHAALPQLLPGPDLPGRLDLFLANLGFLPGSSSPLATRPETTLAALGTAASWLAPGGAGAIIAYSGHPGGLAETAAVAAWHASLSPLHFHREVLPPPPGAHLPPTAFLLQRLPTP